MRRKRYITPKIESITLDKDISLILMSWTDDNAPPDDPFGAAQQAPSAANPFEQNAFNNNTSNE